MEHNHNGKQLGNLYLCNLQDYLFRNIKLPKSTDIGHIKQKMGVLSFFTNDLNWYFSWYQTDAVNISKDIYSKQTIIMTQQNVTYYIGTDYTNTVYTDTNTPGTRNDPGGHDWTLAVKSRKTHAGDRNIFLLVGSKSASWEPTKWMKSDAWI